MHKIIDLSQNIYDLMPVYPGDNSPHLERVNNITKDGFNNYQITTSMHVGTHIDGPKHLTFSKKFINKISPECLVGKGVLLNVSGERIVKRKPGSELQIIPDSIVLLFTGHSRWFGKKKYYNNHPVVSRELAELFIEKKIKMLCIDSPSPDKHPFEIHKLLLSNNILIAENLTNMDKLLAVKDFEVFALPLKICADSSLARIIAREIN